MRKTVLHISGMTSTKYGGMEKYFIELAKQTNDLGYQTILQYEKLPTSQEYLAELKRIGVKVVVIRTSPFNVKAAFKFLSIFTGSFPIFITSHFASREIILFLAMLRKIFRSRKVISVVHNFHHLNKSSKARYAYNFCDSVVGVSDAVKADLLSGLVKPSLLFRHYLGVPRIDTAGFPSKLELRERLGIPAEALVLANISFDSPFKGIDVLIDSLEKAVRVNPQIFLLQIGVDTNASKLPKIAEAKNLKQNICWTGIVDGGASFLIAADVYVQASRYGEGLPLAIMEAMSLSLPCVVTNVSGNAEATQHKITGLVVEPENVNQLSDAILELASSPDLRKQLGEGGLRRFQEEFQLEKSVKKFVDTYLA